MFYNYVGVVLHFNFSLIHNLPMVVEKSRRCLKMLPSCSGASIECGKLILLRNFRRSLCFCTELRAQFNPQLFVDPITELDQVLFK